MGDFSGVNQKIKQLVERNTKFEPFANHVKQFTNEFADEELMAFLKTHLDPREH